VQARDVDAFRELVQLTYTPLVRFARTIVGASDEAEDVVQDVFTVVWDRGARWNPSGDVAAYLFTSVRNHALNVTRQRARDTSRAQRVYQQDDGDANVDSQHTSNTLDHIVQSESESTRTRIVEIALAQLTEHQRTAYDLRYRRGLTVPAIATVLGITTKSAEQLVSRVTRLVLELVRQALDTTK